MNEHTNTSDDPVVSFCSCCGDMLKTGYTEIGLCNKCLDEYEDDSYDDPYRPNQNYSYGDD